jgi:hypothetical protein
MNGKMMKQSISHSFEEESPDAKARWFQSLSIKNVWNFVATKT